MQKGASGDQGNVNSQTGSDTGIGKAIVQEEEEEEEEQEEEEEGGGEEFDYKTYFSAVVEDAAHKALNKVMRDPPALLERLKAKCPHKTFNLDNLEEAAIEVQSSIRRIADYATGIDEHKTLASFVEALIKKRC